jgi:hypothetical protein
MQRYTVLSSLCLHIRYNSVQPSIPLEQQPIRSTDIIDSRNARPFPAERFTFSHYLEVSEGKETTGTIRPSSSCIAFGPTIVDSEFFCRILNSRPYICGFCRCLAPPPLAWPEHRQNTGTVSTQLICHVQKSPIRIRHVLVILYFNNAWFYIHNIWKSHTNFHIKSLHIIAPRCLYPIANCESRIAPQTEIFSAGK